MMKIVQTVKALHVKHLVTFFACIGFMCTLITVGLHNGNAVAESGDGNPTLTAPLITDTIFQDNGVTIDWLPYDDGTSVVDGYKIVRIRQDVQQTVGETDGKSTNLFDGEGEVGDQYAVIAYGSTPNQFISPPSVYSVAVEPDRGNNADVLSPSAGQQPLDYFASNVTPSPGNSQSSEAPPQSVMDPSATSSLDRALNEKNTKTEDQALYTLQAQQRTFIFQTGKNRQGVDQSYAQFCTKNAGVLESDTHLLDESRYPVGVLLLAGCDAYKGLQ